MDKTISASEANRQFSKLLRNVERGARYTITSHGRPVANLTPAPEDDAARRERARDRLLARLKSQPALNLGPWSREEAYDDE